MKWLFSPTGEISIAALFVASSLILWPISMVTFAKNEPPVTLSLSWLALTYAGYSALIAAQGRNDS